MINQIETEDKFEKLKVILREMNLAIIAFSGGVDSAFLLKAAHDVLGKNAIAPDVKLGSRPESVGTK